MLSAIESLMFLTLRSHKTNKNYETKGERNCNEYNEETDRAVHWRNCLHI